MSDPQDNVVVPRDFGCPRCGTIWHCNRAEPSCALEHPGQWHVQVIDFPPEPCRGCDSWVGPWAAQEAADVIEEETGVFTDFGLLFPPEPVTETTDALWAEALAMALLIRS